MARVARVERARVRRRTRSDDYTLRSRSHMGPKGREFFLNLKRNNLSMSNNKVLDLTSKLAAAESKEELVCITKGSSFEGKTLSDLEKVKKELKKEKEDPEADNMEWVEVFSANQQRGKKRTAEAPRTRVSAAAAAAAAAAAPVAVPVPVPAPAPAPPAPVASAAPASVVIRKTACKHVVKGQYVDKLWCSNSACPEIYNPEAKCTFKGCTFLHLDQLRQLLKEYPSLQEVSGHGHGHGVASKKVLERIYLGTEKKGVAAVVVKQEVPKASDFPFMASSSTAAPASGPVWKNVVQAAVPPQAALPPQVAAPTAVEVVTHSSSQDLVRLENRLDALDRENYDLYHDNKKLREEKQALYEENIKLQAQLSLLKEFLPKQVAVVSKTVEGMSTSEAGSAGTWDM